MTTYRQAANELKPLRRIFGKFEDMGVVLEKAATAEADAVKMTAERDRVEAQLQDIKSTLDEKIAASREVLAAAKQEEFAYQEHVVAARKRLDADMDRRVAEHAVAVGGHNVALHNLKEAYDEAVQARMDELYDAEYDLAQVQNAHKDFIASLGK